MFSADELEIELLIEAGIYTRRITVFHPIGENSIYLLFHREDKTWLNTAVFIEGVRVLQ